MKKAGSVTIEPYVDLEACAKAFNLTLSWVKKAIYSLEAPSHDVGGRKVLLSEFGQWLKQRPTNLKTVHGKAGRPRKH